MRTLRQISDELLRLFRQGYPGADEKIDLREVARIIVDAANSMIVPRHFGDRDLEGDMNMDGQVVATFDLDIKKDRRGRNYVEAPDYIRLPKDRGIQRMVQHEEKPGYEAVIPIPSDAMVVAGALPAGIMQGRWTYWCKGDKLFIGKREGKTMLECGFDGVEVDAVIVPYSEEKMDEPFNFPQDMWDGLKRQCMDIMQMAANAPDDKDSDNKIISGQ